MLVYGRFITFGRGINETAIEYESHIEQFPELAIEKDLLLFIPLPTYFFVSPKKPNLQHRRMFKSSNPNLSPETPLHIERYWYNPMH